jgi:hypothetical protein
MLLPVTLLLHLIVPLQPVAVKVAVSAPQILVLLALITGILGLVPVRITMLFDEATLPHELLQVAVYVPELVTVMLLLVAPVLHVKTPLQPVAVSFALAPSQQINLSELITGAVGAVPVLITTALLAPLTPQIFSQTAV